MVEIAESGGGIIYEGMRRSQTPGDIVVVRTEITTRGATCGALKPQASQELYNHSSDGFEWGYAGSGPAQLALALLLDATGDKDLAVSYHQDLKDCFVARWQVHWNIRASEILRWVGLKANHQRLVEEERNAED